jgi:hypothetical protein
VFFLRLLSTRQIIHHCSNPLAKFVDNGDYWRFQCHEEGPLNCKHIWTLPIEDSPCVLIEVMLRYCARLPCSNSSRKLLHLIQLAAPVKTEANGERTLKALERIVPTRAYDDFTREVSMLQKVFSTIALSNAQISFQSFPMTEDERFSFWINTYNLLSMHTLVLYSKRQVRKAVR